MWVQCGCVPDSGLGSEASGGCDSSREGSVPCEGWREASGTKLGAGISGCEGSSSMMPDASACSTRTTCGQSQQYGNSEHICWFFFKR